jgi:hypothetical protein
VDNQSYVIKELNKYANTQANVIARATEGLNIFIEDRIRLIKNIQKTQNNTSDNFGKFNDQVLPFSNKIDNTIGNIQTHYGENPSLLLC